MQARVKGEPRWRRMIGSLVAERHPPVCPLHSVPLDPRWSQTACTNRADRTTINIIRPTVSEQAVISQLKVHLRNFQVKMHKIDLNADLPVLKKSHLTC